MAVAALNGVYSGPPNNPTCCPVRIVPAPCSSAASAAFAELDGFCAASSRTSSGQCAGSGGRSRESRPKAKRRGAPPRKNPETAGSAPASRLRDNTLSSLFRSPAARFVSVSVLPPKFAKSMSCHPQQPKLPFILSESRRAGTSRRTCGCSSANLGLTTRETLISDHAA